jgi:uncharacterized protein YkwD
MKYLSTLFILPLLLLPWETMAQTAVWDSWDAEVVRSLHTARNMPWLSEEEQKVILFMNMARHNGSLFAETFVKTYVEENQVEKTSYLRSLYRDLAKVSELKPLFPEEDLTAVANWHALKSGKTGHVGHRNMKKRFEPLRGNPYYEWGENCSYGFDEALTMVITLLIDEDIEGVGHRKNILKESYNSVGVAIRPHKTYRVNCVMDFGQKSRSDLNKVPY